MATRSGHKGSPCVSISHHSAGQGRSVVGSAFVSSMHLRARTGIRNSHGGLSHTKSLCVHGNTHGESVKSLGARQKRGGERNRSKMICGRPWHSDPPQTVIYSPPLPPPPLQELKKKNYGPGRRGGRGVGGEEKEGGGKKGRKSSRGSIQGVGKSKGQRQGCGQTG